MSQLEIISVKSLSLAKMKSDKLRKPTFSIKFLPFFLNIYSRVVAMSDITLLSMEKQEFLFVFGDNIGQSCSTVVQNLLRLSDSRKTDLITLIFKFKFKEKL